MSIRKFFRSIFNSALQRGQVMVLYALLIPLLFLFVGVGMDLGWYYLNVSRLQNAADAAALAGASALVKEEDFNNYLVIALAPNKLPADFDDYADVFKNTFDASTIANGKLSNYHKIDDIKETLKKGRDSAEEYTRKNLEDTAEVKASDDNTSTLSATDYWSISKKDVDKKVSGTIELKYKIVDGKNDVYGPLYYVVSLREKIRHFFLPGWFDDMNAPVKAVVLLKPHYKGLIDPMEQLERTKVIDNWEYTKEYKDPATGLSVSGGKWNHYQAGIRSNSNYGIRYTSGNAYRNESVIVKTSRKTSGKNVITSADGSSGEATDANGGKWYSSDEVDSINIDFRAEVKGKFSSDWDLGYDFPETGHSYQFTENSWSATNGADKRILFNAEFDEAFPTRDTSKQADPLWVRIESDPIKNPYTGAGVSNFNSVRQITLNFNTDNTQVDDKDNPHYYINRPYVVFYTGPENIDYTTDANGVLIRHSQPVVINLNDNLNAIIYMPESPVIINGNNKKFKGFVIAKCFLQTVTSEEMTNNSKFYLYDGFNTPTLFRGNYVEGTDGNSNTVYFKPDDLLDRNEIDPNYLAEDTTITEDGSGNVVVREKLKVNNYILLNYTKADHDTYAVTEDGKLNENKTFAAYVNATYKEKYKTVSGLSDSQITAVSFPDENYNETTATYYVDSRYVSSNKENDNYVKVLVNGSTMYADKKKLPYVKVRFNANYFYVCVSDLQLLKDSNGNKNGNKGVRMVDATDGDKDIYVNPTSIDQYGDSWKIDRAYWDTQGNWKNWQKDKVEFSADGTYFMLKSEIAALTTDPQVIDTYRKITYTDGDEEKVKYAKAGEKLYYTKVYNNEKNHDNYIIVDENGNMLTKSITVPEVLTATDEDSNVALKSKAERVFGLASEAPLRDYWKTYTRYPNGTPETDRADEVPPELPGDKKPNIVDGKYRGNSEYRLYEDYRIPALERVYKRSTFNLNEESYYSYFDIEELWRVNYTYLNVDEFNHTVDRKESDNWKVEDMFFTAKRAAWID